MSVDLRYQLAAGEAETRVKTWGLSALPVDPFSIAQERGIDVMPKDSSEPGVSGFLLKVGDTFGIMYATHIDNPGFKRFTVAHELGHYFLDGHVYHLFPNGNGLHASKSGFISKAPHELEADHFAAALLMPEPLFREALREAGAGFAAIESLAATCGTSITATAIRFAQFSEDPVAVLVSSSNKISYCFLSESLKSLQSLEWARKGELVPPRTATYRFNQDPENVTQGKRIESSTTLSRWFDGAPEIDMNEDVVGLGSYGKTLTVLFTTEAIEEDEEDVDEDDEE